MGQSLRSVATVAATAIVALVFLRGCLLPEVASEGVSVRVDAGHAEMRNAGSLSTLPAVPNAAQAAPMNAAPPMLEQKADAGQPVAVSASTADASVSDQAAGRAQDAGAAKADRPAADDSSAAACSCQAKNECCDGCRPLNEGGACPPDGYACTLEICRAGTCVHEDRTDACWVDGLCHKAGDAHLTNKCLVCDPSLNIKGWSPRHPSSPCHDSNPCNGDDYCGANNEAGVCIHSGNPCEGSDLTCDSFTGMCKNPN